jgi:hypothetical protein
VKPNPGQRLRAKRRLRAARVDVVHLKGRCGEIESNARDTRSGSPDAGRVGRRESGFPRNIGVVQTAKRYRRSRCLNSVKRAVLTLCQPLPVYPYERTSLDRPVGPVRVPTADLHKAPEGVRVHLDGRQPRDAPCGSVADQRGEHEIKGLPKVRSSSGGRGGHKCVRRILKEGSNNGATAPADEHQLAVAGLPLSEDILPLREVAGRMIGS